MTRDVFGRDWSRLTFRLTCGSAPVADGGRTAVVGSDRTRRVLDAGSRREGESSEVCCVGETR